MSNQQKYCGSCGAKRETEASFCGGCGCRLAKPSPWDPGLVRQGKFWLGALVAFGLVLVWFALKPETKNENNNQTGASTTETQTVADSERLALERAATGGSANAIMDLVDYYLRQSKTDPTLKSKAAHSLHLFLDRYPDHAFALRLLGNIYFDLKMAQLAQQTYQRYLDQYPNDANVRTDFGTVLLAGGQVDAAISAYLQALEAFPGFYNALFNLSVAYERKGDPIQAGVYRQKAQEVENLTGRLMPPQLNLPRLPSPGGAASDTPKSTMAPTGQAAQGTLERFLKNHPIIAPKIDDFQKTGNTAILRLRNFPMESMPEAVRQSLKLKLLEALEQDDQITHLELRDAANGRLLAAYTGSP